MFALAGCGRLGFDTAASVRSDGGSDPDAAIDTPVGQACATDLECGRCGRCAGTCQVEPVNALFLGHRSTCYLGANGDRWCTGDNMGGQLGLGDELNRSTPERALDGGGWEALYLHYYGAAIGLRAGQEYRWGGGPGNTVPTMTGASHAVRGALGDLDFRGWWDANGTSTIDASGAVWMSLSYGADHACGVNTDGALYCWGTNRSGSLGQDMVAENAMIALPDQVGTDNNWVAAAVGGDLDKGFSCGIRSSGRVFCWGHPFFTGTNGVDVGAGPTAIYGDHLYTWVQANWEHACAGDSAGVVRCWGHDTYGGFVAPGLTDTPIPVIVDGVYAKWVMGGHHACGLTAGAAPRWRCFGWNISGQLGIGNVVNDGALHDLCP